MAHHFQHVPDDRREPHEIEVPGLWNAYFLAVLVVILTGLISGTVYIVWRLIAARTSTIPSPAARATATSSRPPVTSSAIWRKT